MKKLFFILIGSAMFSCSNDDDMQSSNLAEDQLIGTWKYTTYIENNTEQILEPCELEETLIFDSQGTYTGMYYETDANNSCVLEQEGSGVWENNGDNSYTLTILGESFTEDLFFEENTFYLEFIDNSGTPNDTSDDIVVRDVYTKQ